MKKIKIKKIHVSDKIRFSINDLIDSDIYDLRDRFSWNLQDERFSILDEYEGSDIVELPSNAWWALEYDEVVDERCFPKKQEFEFEGTLRAEQEAVSDAFLLTKSGNIRSGIFQAACGWGKCKPHFSRILTDKGYLSLEELKYCWNNTKVINHKGKYKIIDFYDNKLEECYEVKTQIGNIVRGTAKHPLLTWNAQLLRLEFKKINDLTTQDYIVGKYNTNLFGSNKIEDPYLIGILIGDGSLTVLNRIGFASADKELQEYFTKIFPNSIVVTKNNHKEYYINNKSLYKKYVTNFNIGCKSIEKPICSELRQLNKEQTILLLRGLFDTDGCANNDGTVEFCSSSKDIAYYVFEQLLNLGIISRIKKKKTNKNDTYIIDINSKYECLKFYNLVGFSIERKQKRKDIIGNKSFGSTLTGNFVNLNKLVYKLYKEFLTNKGYSKKFSNYKNNNISLRKFNESVEILGKYNVDYTEIKDYINSYAAKVVSINSIGVQQTYDISVDETACYVSEGIINHNTFAGTQMLAKSKTKCLVLVHSTLLFNQWIAELKNLVPDATIGMIGDGHDTTGDIDVGIYKSVVNRLDKVRSRYGLVLVDEVHLCPADLFGSCLNGINAKIKIGVSATPKRKDGRHAALPYYFTTFNVVAEDFNKRSAEYEIIKTDIPFNIRDPKVDWARSLNKLSKDEAYINLIANRAIRDINRGRVPLILFPRLEMLDALAKKIPNSIKITGSTTNREELLKDVGSIYKCVLSTTIFDEGVSCHRLDTYYSICPENNPYKREQRIGRIQRDHASAKYPCIRDFFLKGKFVEKQQINRLNWYKQVGYKEIYDNLL